MPYSPTLLRTPQGTLARRTTTICGALAEMARIAAMSVAFAFSMTGILAGIML